MYAVTSLPRLVVWLESTAAIAAAEMRLLDFTRQAEIAAKLKPKTWWATVGQYVGLSIAAVGTLRHSHCE